MERYLSVGITTPEQTSQFLDEATTQANAQGVSAADKNYWLNMANALTGQLQHDYSNATQSAQAELSKLQEAEATLKNNQRGLRQATYFGKQGADDVDVLRDERIDRDEKVASGDSCIPHHLDGRGHALDCDDICDGRQLGQALGIAVDDRDLVGLAAEHLGQVRSHLSGSFNDYSHNTIFDSI
jgi:hypothetical protein